MPRAKILVIKLPRITKVLVEGCESRNNHRYHVVAQDLATQWLRSYPCSQEIQKSLQSTPHRPETNGIVEKAVCTIQEGKSAVLLQSGLYEKLWADSMECFCCLRVGKTPYGRRFGVPFNGPVILLGAMLEYHLISAKDISRLHKFGPKVLPGTLERRRNGSSHWRIGADGRIWTPRPKAQRRGSVNFK